MSARRSLIAPAAAGLALVLAIPSCSVGSSSMRATFADPELGQVYMRTLDSHRIAVAFYRDGRLDGAARAYRLADHSWASDWLQSREAVDPPELPVWRQTLGRMQRLADARGADPRELLRLAGDQPFSDARRDCVLAWVDHDPERAATIVDDIDAAGVGRATGTELVELALRAPQGDARLSRWMAALAAGNDRDGCKLVIAAPGAGPETARTTLRELDEFSSSVRAVLFEAAVPRLAAPLSHADRDLLVRAVDRLPSSAEAPAILRVFETPAMADAALGRAVLGAIEDFRSSDRLDVMLAAARCARGDRAGADAIGDAIDELPSRDRWPGAAVLLEEGADSELVVALLRAAHTLPTRDRASLVEAALRQAHWDDRIAVAAQAAVADVSGRDRRNELRQAVEARASRSGRQ